MIHRILTSNAPTANGRKPHPGEQQWTLTFTHENGDDYIEIVIGKRGRSALLAMFAQEDHDDAIDSQNEKLKMGDSMSEERLKIIHVEFMPGSTYLALRVISGQPSNPIRIVEFGDKDSSILFDGIKVCFQDALMRLVKPHEVTLHTDSQRYGVSVVAEFYEAKS